MFVCPGEASVRPRQDVRRRARSGRDRRPPPAQSTAAAAHARRLPALLAGRRAPAALPGLGDALAWLLPQPGRHAVPRRELRRAAGRRGVLERGASWRVSIFLTLYNLPVTTFFLVVVGRQERRNKNN